MYKGQWKIADICSRIQTGTSFENVIFYEREIFRILSQLKNNMSSGPDRLPPILFKNLAGVLALPIAMICNFCFDIGKLPTIWKAAVVTPVFKKGCSSCVENYRPMSLTCVAYKVFETVIKNYMQNFMLQHSLLNSAQHGFLVGHSTCTNLL